MKKKFSLVHSLLIIDRLLVLVLMLELDCGILEEKINSLVKIVIIKIGLVVLDIVQF